MTLIKQIFALVLSPSPTSLAPVRFIILLNISWQATQNVGKIITKDFSLSTDSLLCCSKSVVNYILLPVRQTLKGDVS